MDLLKVFTVFIKEPLAGAPHGSVELLAENQRDALADAKNLLPHNDSTQWLVVPYSSQQVERTDR